MIRPSSKIEFLRQLEILAKGGNKPEFHTLFDAIKQGRKRLADASIVSVEDATGVTTLKMFNSDDNKIVGLKTLDRGKLAKGQFVLVDRIQITAVNLGVEAYSDAKASAADFDLISSIANLQNGWLGIQADKKFVVNELPMGHFVTDENTQINRGVYYLDNPFMLVEDETLEATIDLKVAAADNTVVKLVLAGTGTLPN